MQSWPFKLGVVLLGTSLLGWILRRIRSTSEHLRSRNQASGVFESTLSAAS